MAGNLRAPNNPLVRRSRWLICLLLMIALSADCRFCLLNSLLASEPLICPVFVRFPIAPFVRPLPNDHTLCLFPIAQLPAIRSR
ncbi:MAG: hypothetical protein LBN32_02645 [Helicobacteraceae bacterium]|nr:hypothetical protein [Helicobacteraceae bacterium]